MRTKWLILSNAAFLKKAKVSRQSVLRFYPEDEVEIIIHEYPMIDNGRYLQGLAEARIAHAISALDDYDQSVILGADCVLYENVDTLFSTVGDIVLIPNRVHPPLKAEDNYVSGCVNGDLVLFRNTQNARNAGHWLLTQKMVIDKEHGIFLEQTHMTSLPYFFDRMGICRDDGINVARYNLHERDVHGGDGKYTVNGTLLRMFQFSNYPEGHPEQVCNGYTPEQAAQILANPALKSIFYGYQKMLDEVQ